MALREGIFYGEGRLWAFPTMDLNGVPVNQLNQSTPAQNPLQFSMDGDWGIYGYQAFRGTIDAGGLPTNTPLNLQIMDQNTSESQFRQSNSAIILGAPLNHIAGKAGNPAYISWPRTVEAGARLYPYLGWLGLPTDTTPTGRSPVYVVAVAQLLRPGLASGIPIGSRAMQLRHYGGYYATYTGSFIFTDDAPLAPNGSDAIQVPITGKKFFFVDSLWCRMVNGTQNMGPNNDLNPQTVEDEILVSVRDTNSLSAWNQPGFVPVWTMFGNMGGRPFCPPSPFVVRPLGNIEVSIKNGESAPAINYRIDFTFGGVLVEIPADVLQAASILKTSTQASGATAPGLLAG